MMIYFEKFILWLYKFKYFQNIFDNTVQLTRKFAWLLSPFFSMLRFRRVCKIGDCIADWRSKSEKQIESLAKIKISPFLWGSFELRLTNYIYGHAKVLKNYTALPDIYPLKVCYSHGVAYCSSDYDPHLPQLRTYDFSIPAFLAWGNWEATMMAHHRPDNKVYVIGVPFLYAENLFSDEYIYQEKMRLGKNLLVFPSHSTHRTLADFNIQEFIVALNEFKKRFESIRICLYWKDIQYGLHQRYIENGFECVTAGHMMDCNYISRLKGLFSICDATVTNSLGSHIGYSIVMNKPILMIKKSNEKINTALDYNLKTRRDVIASEIHRLEELLLANNSLEISDEIQEITDFFWGFSQKKTKEELRQIFSEAEELFRKSPCRHTFLSFI